MRTELRENACEYAHDEISNLHNQKTENSKLCPDKTSAVCCIILCCLPCWCLSLSGREFTSSDEISALSSMMRVLLQKSTESLSKEDRATQTIQIIENYLSNPYMKTTKSRLFTLRAEIASAYNIKLQSNATSETAPLLIK